MTHIDPFLHMLNASMEPQGLTQPPEPSLRAQEETEAAEFMAGEEFDDMTKEAMEFVLDEPDLIEPILKATIQRNLYGDNVVLLKEILDKTIAKAREDFIEARLKGRA